MIMIDQSGPIVKPGSAASEAELTPTGESPETGSLATSKSSASDISISDSGRNVNPVNNEGGNSYGTDRFMRQL